MENEEEMNNSEATPIASNKKPMMFTRRVVATGYGAGKGIDFDNDNINVSLADASGLEFDNDNKLKIDNTVAKQSVLAAEITARENADIALQNNISNLSASKQDKLKEGTNIHIAADGTISADGKKYLASKGIEINDTNNTISTKIDEETLTYTDEDELSVNAWELTNGANISITNDETNKKFIIAATDTTYTAGDGIAIQNNVISCTRAQDDGTSSNLTAGDGISIQGNVISCTVTPTNYTAGTGIAIQDNVISSTITPLTAGDGIAIQNGAISCTVTPTNYTAGNGISIQGNVISSKLTAGNGISIQSNEISCTVSPQNLTAGTGIAIQDNVVSCTVTPTNYTAGTGISIQGNTISCTLTPQTLTAGDGISISGNVISSTVTQGIVDQSLSTTFAIEGMEVVSSEPTSPVANRVYLIIEE